jgi:hypothetical protein
MTSKIIVCSDTTLKYFIEYMNTFEGYTCMNYSTLCRTPGRCEELLILQNAQFISDSILHNADNVKIVQTEQLCTPVVEERVISELRNISSRYGKPITVIDYSHINREIIESHGFACQVREYISPPQEIIILQKLLENEKRYDFAFVGCINARRQTILNRLKERGYTILIISTFGKERDMMISQCRFLLNIHYEEYFNIFESIRCNRWLQAGMHVISEASIDPPSFSNLHLYSYDSICDESFIDRI